MAVSGLSAPPVEGGRGWRPILEDLVLVFLFLSLTFLLGVFPLKDTDFWWHLRTGDTIRQTGGVPYTDSYTFGAAGHVWVDLHWLFEVLLSWGYQHGGIPALNLAKCAVTTVAMLLLITARRRDWPMPVILITWLPALLVLSGRMYVRPETMTFFFLACDLAILMRWERMPYLGLLLPVVQVLWVNTQGLFVLGLILLAFALIDAAYQRGAFRRERRGWWLLAALISVLTGLACLVNPYGVRGAIFPLELARTMRNPIFSESIAELMSVQRFVARAGFANLPLQLHLSAIVLGGLSFVLPWAWGFVVDRLGRNQPRPEAIGPGKAASFESRTRPGIFRGLLFVFFTYLGFQATRNTHQFAAVIGTVTAWNFAEWAALVRARREALTEPTSGYREEVRAVRQVQFRKLREWLVTAVVLLGTLVFVGSGKFYALAGEGRTIGLGEEPNWFPHAAVKAAGRPGVPDRIVCFHDGHAALYEYVYAPARKTYVDARLEVMGAELYTAYMALDRSIALDLRTRDALERARASLPKNDSTRDHLVIWPEALNELGKPAVLVDLVQAGNAELAATFLLTPDWKCIWFDGVAAVFVPASCPAARDAIDFARRHFHPGPDALPTSVADAVARARASALVATVLEQRRRHDLAQPIILVGLDSARAALERDEGKFEVWKYLGALETMWDQIEAPRFRMPFDPVFDLSPARASYALRQAVALNPSDFNSMRMLAGSYFQRGMYEVALPLYRRLAVASPPGQRHNAEMLQREAKEMAARCTASLGSASVSPEKSGNDPDAVLRSYLSTGRVDSARRLLEATYPLGPAMSENVANLLGNMYLQLGRPTLARSVWESTDQARSNAVNVSHVAATYLIENKFEIARGLYKQAVAREPRLFEANYGRALLELLAGHPTAAHIAASNALSTADSDASREAARFIQDFTEPYYDPNGLDETEPKEETPAESPSTQ